MRHLGRYRQKAQRGFVHLLLLVFAVLGLTMWGASELQQLASEQKKDIRVESDTTLASARRALINYALLAPESLEVSDAPSAAGPAPTPDRFIIYYNGVAAAIGGGGVYVPNGLTGSVAITSVPDSVLTMLATFPVGRVLPDGFGGSIIVDATTDPAVLQANRAVCPSGLPSPALPTPPYCFVVFEPAIVVPPPPADGTAAGRYNAFRPGVAGVAEVVADPLAIPPVLAVPPVPAVPPLAIPHRYFLLPCPDVAIGAAGDANLDGISDILQTHPAGCAVSGASYLAAGSRFGRLPWRDANLADSGEYVRGLGGVDYRDGNNQRLWYALASNLSGSEQPLNPHALMRQTSGWLTVVDENGAALSDRVAAAVIAPGLFGPDDSGTRPNEEALAPGGGAAPAAVNEALVTAYLDPPTYSGFLAGTLTIGARASDEPGADQLEYITIDELAAEGSEGIGILEGAPRNLYDLMAGEGDSLGVVELLDEHLQRYGFLPAPAMFDDGTAASRRRASGAPVQANVALYSRFDSVGEWSVTIVNAPPGGHITFGGTLYNDGPLPDVAAGDVINSFATGAAVTIEANTPLAELGAIVCPQGLTVGYTSALPTGCQVTPALPPEAGFTLPLQQGALFNSGASPDIALRLSDLPPVYLLTDVTINAAGGGAAGADGLLPPYGAALAGLETALNDVPVPTDWSTRTTVQAHYPAGVLAGLQSPSLVAVLHATTAMPPLPLPQPAAANLAIGQEFVVMLADVADGYFVDETLISIVTYPGHILVRPGDGAPPDAIDANTENIPPYAAKIQLPAGTRLTLRSDNLIARFPAETNLPAPPASTYDPITGQWTLTGGLDVPVQILAGPSQWATVTAPQHNRRGAGGHPVVAGDIGFLPIEDEAAVADAAIAYTPGMTVSLQYDASAISQLAVDTGLVAGSATMVIVPFPPPGDPAQLAPPPTPTRLPANSRFIAPAGSRIIYPAGGEFILGDDFRFPDGSVLQLAAGAVLAADVLDNAVLPGGEPSADAASRLITLVHGGFVNLQGSVRPDIADSEVIGAVQKLFDVELRTGARVAGNPAAGAVIRPFLGFGLIPPPPVALGSATVIFGSDSLIRAGFLRRPKYTIVPGVTEWVVNINFFYQSRDGTNYAATGLPGTGIPVFATVNAGDVITSRETNNTVTVVVDMPIAELGPHVCPPGAGFDIDVGTGPIGGNFPRPIGSTDPHCRLEPSPPSGVALGSPYGEPQEIANVGVRIGAGDIREQLFDGSGNDLMGIVSITSGFDEDTQFFFPSGHHFRSPAESSTNTDELVLPNNMSIFDTDMAPPLGEITLAAGEEITGPLIWNIKEEFPAFGSASTLTLRHQLPVTIAGTTVTTALDNHLVLYPDADMWMGMIDGSVTTYSRIAAGSIVDLLNRVVHPPAGVQRLQRVATDKAVRSGGVSRIYATDALYLDLQLPRLSITLNGGVRVAVPTAAPDSMDMHYVSYDDYEASAGATAPAAATLNFSAGFTLPAGSYIQIPPGGDIDFLSPEARRIAELNDHIHLPQGAVAVLADGAAVTVTGRGVFITVDAMSMTVTMTSTVAPAPVTLTGPAYLGLSDGTNAVAIEVTNFATGEPLGNEPLVFLSEDAYLRSFNDAASLSDKIYAPIPAATRLDLFGYMEQRTDSGFYAGVMPPDSRRLFEDFPMIYAVAPECRQRGAQNPGADCAEALGEGFEFTLNVGEEYLLREPLALESAAVITSAYSGVNLEVQEFQMGDNIISGVRAFYIITDETSPLNFGTSFYVPDGMGGTGTVAIDRIPVGMTIIATVAVGRVLTDNGGGNITVDASTDPAVLAGLRALCPGELNVAINPPRGCRSEAAPLVPPTLAPPVTTYSGVAAVYIGADGTVEGVDAGTGAGIAFTEDRRLLVYSTAGNNRQRELRAYMDETVTVGGDLQGVSYVELTGTLTVYSGGYVGTDYQAATGGGVLVSGALLTLGYGAKMLEISEGEPIFGAESHAVLEFEGGGHSAIVNLADYVYADGGGYNVSVSLSADTGDVDVYGDHYVEPPPRAGQVVSVVSRDFDPATAITATVASTGVSLVEVATGATIPMEKGYLWQGYVPAGSEFVVEENPDAGGGSREITDYYAGSSAPSGFQATVDIAPYVTRNLDLRVQSTVRSLNVWGNGNERPEAIDNISFTYAQRPNTLTAGYYHFGAGRHTRHETRSRRYSDWFAPGGNSAGLEAFLHAGNPFNSPITTQATDAFARLIEVDTAAAAGNRVVPLTMQVAVRNTLTGDVQVQLADWIPVAQFGSDTERGYVRINSGSSSPLPDSNDGNSVSDWTRYFHTNSREDNAGWLPFEWMGRFNRAGAPENGVIENIMCGGARAQAVFNVPHTDLVGGGNNAGGVERIGSWRMWPGMQRSAARPVQLASGGPALPVPVAVNGNAYDIFSPAVPSYGFRLPTDDDIANNDLATLPAYRPGILPPSTPAPAYSADFSATTVTVNTFTDWTFYMDSAYHELQGDITVTQALFHIVADSMFDVNLAPPANIPDGMGGFNVIRTIPFGTSTIGAVAVGRVLPDGAGGNITVEATTAPAVLEANEVVCLEPALRVGVFTCDVVLGSTIAVFSNSPYSQTGGQTLAFGDDFSIHGPAAIVPPFAGQSEAATREVYGERSYLFSQLLDTPALPPLYDALTGDCRDPNDCEALYANPYWFPIVGGVLAFNGLQLSFTARDAATATEPATPGNNAVRLVLPQPQAEVETAGGGVATIYAGSIIYPRQHRILGAQPLPPGAYELVPVGDVIAHVDVSPRREVNYEVRTKEAQAFDSGIFNFAPTQATTPTNAPTDCVVEPLGFVNEPPYFELDVRRVAIDLINAAGDEPPLIPARSAYDVDTNNLVAYSDLCDGSRFGSQFMGCSTGFVSPVPADPNDDGVRTTYNPAWYRYGEIYDPRGDIIHDYVEWVQGVVEDNRLPAPALAGRTYTYEPIRVDGSYNRGYLASDAALTLLTSYYSGAPVFTQANGFAAVAEDAAGRPSGSSTVALTGASEPTHNSDVRFPNPGSFFWDDGRSFIPIGVADISVAARTFPPVNPGGWAGYDDFNWSRVGIRRYDPASLPASPTGFNIIAVGPQTLTGPSRLVPQGTSGSSSSSIRSIIEAATGTVTIGFYYLGRSDLTGIGGPATESTDPVLLAGQACELGLTLCYAELFTPPPSSPSDREFTALRLAHSIRIPASATMTISGYNPDPYPASADTFFTFPTGSEAVVINNDMGSWLSANPFIGLHRQGTEVTLNNPIPGGPPLATLTVAADNDAYSRVDISGMHVVHYQRSESAQRADELSAVPVRTNVWLRLLEGGELVPAGGGERISLAAHTFINPVLGTYISLSDVVGGSGGGGAVGGELLNQYRSDAVAHSEVRLVRPALQLPTGARLVVGAAGARVRNVKAAVFFSLAPLESVQCPTGVLDGATGQPDTVGLNQIREGVSETAYDDPASGRSFGIGHPCAWLDDPENMDGDRFFVYRSRRRYVDDNVRVRAVSNDRTYLLGGRLELGA